MKGAIGLAGLDGKGGLGGEDSSGGGWHGGTGEDQRPADHGGCISQSYGPLHFNEHQLVLHGRAYTQTYRISALTWRPFNTCSVAKTDRHAWPKAQSAVMMRLR